MLMRGFFVTALAACVAIFVFAGAKPASALPAKAALNYSHTNADLVEVKKWYKKRYYRGGRYYRGPRYRSYRYRPYYGYRYRPYGYRRRGGVTIWW
jgi:hypothetical protein